MTKNLFMELCAAVAVSKVVTDLFYTGFGRCEGLSEKILWFSTREASQALRDLGMSAVMIATIFMSTSRGGIMSFVLSQLVFFSVLFWAFSRRRKGKRLAAVVVAVALLAGGMVLWLGPGTFIKKFRGTSIEKILQREGPDAGRMHVYDNTLQVIREFPAAGTGLGTFGTNFSRYRSSYDSGTDYLRYAHNDYLELVSETGAGGAVFLIFFMILYLRAMTGVMRKLV